MKIDIYIYILLPTYNFMLVCLILGFVHTQFVGFSVIFILRQTSVGNRATNQSELEKQGHVTSGKRGIPILFCRRLPEKISDW